MWGLIVIGFWIVVAITLFKIAWYIFILLLAVVINVIGWVIEKAKGE